MWKGSGRVMASKADSGHWSFSNAGPRRAGENGATISATHIGETHMTPDQKQKVMQLLELCIDNNKINEYECSFDIYPSNYGSISVHVYLAGDHSSFGESYSIATELDKGDSKLAAAIEAIRTLPERATALIAAKEEARREKLIKEYEEVFGKKN